jgi:acetyl esterase
MNLKHIVVAGDSAGGHLATAVCLLAILRGFKVPDGLIIHYPSLTLDSKFYPSVMLSLDDAILSQHFMKFVLSCFTRNNCNPDKSPILSPVYAPAKLLNLLPLVRIFASEVDSLRDQSLFFLHRLIESDNF